MSDEGGNTGSRRFVDDSGSSSGASVSTSRCRTRRVVSDNSDSDSGSEIETQSRKRRVPRVKSDNDSDSSGSIITKRLRGPLRLASESESASGSSSSAWETEHSDTETAKVVVKPKTQDVDIESDSSDGQSEKCPICLLSFTTQEIGTPESCDHVFCADCIQEWSKNMNTCPVDRQEFRLILVRKRIDGKITRQISVTPPQPHSDVEIVEDPTFCEICGSSDREDRMLLCDGCDLGFHMHCLTPPLQTVPIGAWFCGDCSPDDLVDPEVEIYELQLLLDDAQRPVRRIPRQRRLAPRTGDTERLRRRIANNRTRQTTDASAAVSSTSTRTRRPKKKRKPRRNYRIVYTIDEATGETVAVKVPVKKRRKKRKNRIAKLPKTVKKRLALQLGMCARGSVPQNLPDVKVINPGNSGNIQRQRYNAGIPTLHLFGPQNDILLDDFSDIDDDNGGVLSRRAPNRHDIAALRRARVKNSVSLPNNPVSSSSDLLGDILDCQAKFHSKNSKLSLGKDGRITVESKPVDLNNHQQSVRQRPLNYSNDSVPSSSGTSTYTPSNQQQENNSVPTSTVTSINPSNITTSQYGSQQESEDFPSSQRNLSSSIYDPDDNPNKDKDNKKQDSRSNTPGSESEIDIYSDIETVSTSKNDETEYKPSPQQTNSNTPLTEEDDNDSEPDMVIDTEKPEPESDNVKDETVSSTVNSNLDSNSNNPQAVTSTSDLVESSTSHQLFNDGPVHEEEEDSEDGCPNFSIYSKESHTLAKNTDVTLDAGEDTNQVEEITSSPALVSADEIAHADREVGEIFDEPEQTEDEAVDKIKKKSSTSGLYSDSEDESVVKKGVTSSFGISDIANMTEDISEEERSYTPCLDERVPVTQGLDGLDTEMISDEERNDFDESHDLKTVSDGGEALEINAKESELDFTRPEDYEEGEIVDKLKNVVIKPEEEVVVDSEAIKQDGEDKKKATNKKSKEGEHNNSKSSELSVTKIEKENEKSSANNKRQSTEKESAFKKLSRSNKERNYRDKDRDHKSRSRSRDKKDKESSNKKSDRKRERRKEIERYDVRAIIADKPRRLKDKFGRDVRRTASRTRSRTRTPTSPVVVNRRSRSKRRRSLSRADRKTRRTAARRSSVSRSRTRSRDRRRNRSKEKKKTATTARRRTRSRSPSPPPKRQKEFGRRRSREWSASLSRSRSRSQQQQDVRHFTPSWTPPRVMESAVKQHNLTVILTNDNKKKKDKKKKEKRAKENEKVKKKKQSREVLRTPPPSKEVFASGDNILVSVSFNKENETSSRDISTKRKRDSMTTEESGVVKKRNKEKRVKSRLSKKPNKDLSGVKPVAIIDLERSPFKELTPSPKDVIVLSDSDNEDKGGDKNIICDSSSAQVASPERCITSYSSGPKTPPEPQVKFTLTSKTPQMRAISNPLHEPEEDVEQQTTCDGDVDDLHKGPNTPPDPPNSPPSSPDAYDPFEPTKSRSPTPDNKSTAGNQSSSQLNTDDNHPLLDQVGEIQPETSEKSLTQTPDALKSHTPPPLLDVQQPDSQSSIQATPESLIGGKSPADSGGSQTVSVKPVAQTVPLSSSSSAAAAAATSLITSTPVSSNSRINVLNSMPVPRIVLPSPVKISPTKSTSAVKTTPIKPMVSSKSGSTNRGNKNQNGSGLEVTGESLSLDSPYSPGSSDYEDLFEPPSENVAGAKQAAATPAVKTAKTTKSPAKIQTAFDALFGSPFNKKGKGDNSKGGNKFVTKKAALASGKTKQVGVKVDEDSLKILDELPNSAVEMQVKDKFLKKLNRQERVVEEVKLVLKPHYNKKHINKEEYKDILRRAVPKICHNKSGEINPTKIKHLIEAYVKKVRHSKKVTSSSSVNPQKA